MEAFYHLSSANAAERTKAAQEIIDPLEQKDEYVLKRLVKGVYSNRMDSRLGFGNGLVMLLQKFKYDLNDIIIHADTEDYSIGGLFLVQALLDSDMLDSTSAENMAMYCIKIYLHKSYSRIAATHLLLLILEKFPIGTIPSAFLKDGVTCADHIWFCIAASNFIPDVQVWKSILAGWKHNNVLHTKNLSKLMDILKDSSYEPSITHPVFGVIIDAVTVQAETFSIVQFWERVDSKVYLI
jgi:hypothetical protein